MKISANIDNSSLIESIGWSGTHNDLGDLIVEFISNEDKKDEGPVFYRYSDVPLKEILELLNAESSGKYFCKNIRDKYKTKRI